MSKLIDLTGQTFGRLKVIRRVENNNRNQARWLCLCICGDIAQPMGFSLRGGYTKSCGCLRRECSSVVGRITGPMNGRKSASKRIRHGHTWHGGRTATYMSWQCMIQRCTNPNNKRWNCYGGRGIRICERWLHSFENFLAEMGERPEGKTLDRYPDNNGNYEPSNCRWATRKQQMRNRRTAAEIRCAT